MDGKRLHGRVLFSPRTHVLRKYVKVNFHFQVLIQSRLIDVCGVTPRTPAPNTAFVAPISNLNQDIKRDRQQIRKQMKPINVICAENKVQQCPSKL